MNKALVLLLLTAALVAANPVANCTPVLSPDGQNVPLNCPQISAQIQAIPNSVWLGAFEDVSFTNGQNGGDQDFNDFMFSVTFNNLGTSALVQYTGNGAARWNTLLLNGTPLFTTGSYTSNWSDPTSQGPLNEGQLIFNTLGGSPAVVGSTMTVNSTPGGFLGLQLFTDDITGAYDKVYNLGTQQDWAYCVGGAEKCTQPPTVTPEPKTISLLGLGLLAMFLMVRYPRHAKQS